MIGWSRELARGSSDRDWQVRRGIEAGGMGVDENATDISRLVRRIGMINGQWMASKRRPRDLEALDRLGLGCMIPSDCISRS